MADLTHFDESGASRMVDTSAKPETQREARASGRVRMRMIPDFRAKTIIPFLMQNISPGSTIYTDGLKSLRASRKLGSNMLPALNRCDPNSVKAPNRLSHLPIALLETSSNG